MKDGWFMLPIFILLRVTSFKVLAEVALPFIEADFLNVGEESRGTTRVVLEPKKAPLPLHLVKGVSCTCQWGDKDAVDALSFLGNGTAKFLGLGLAEIGETGDVFHPLAASFIIVAGLPVAAKDELD